MSDILEHFADEFNRNFEKIKDTKIVLYGTGTYTGWILNYCRNFSVVGLLDGTQESGEAFGVPVFSLAQLVDTGCENVIIVSNLSVAKIIYRRIKETCEKAGIGVFFLNGLCPRDFRPDVVLEQNTVCSIEDLLHLAEEYDIISFDFFDTLVSRKCLKPENVFGIVEAKALNEGIYVADFTEKRKSVEKLVYRTVDRFFDIETIYDALRGQLSFGVAEARRLMEIELETELELVEPIKDMVFCINQLREQGKTVIICSDTSLHTSMIEQIGTLCGVQSVDIWTSCDRKTMKHDGSMFAALKKEFPNKRILHIGDNMAADIERGKEHNIAVCYCANSAARMSAYGFEKKLPVCGRDDEVVYALFTKKLFSDTFHDRDEDGRILISSGEDVGYLFWGPLVAGYLGWLMRVVKEERLQYLFLISRDGYLFEKLYKQYRKQFDLPEACYLLVSRYFLNQASIRTKDDISFALKQLVVGMGGASISKILEDIFGVQQEQIKQEHRGSLVKNFSLSELEQLVLENYTDEILRNACVQRSRYKKYIDQFQIPYGEKIGMMNFVGRGNTQRCLQKTIEQDILGLYYAVEEEVDEILDQSHYASWYPDRVSTHTSKLSICIQCLEGECVFSSDQGSLKGFKEDGTPIYQETSAKRVAFMQACHRGIEEYLKDLEEIMHISVLNFRPSISLVDTIYGMLTDPSFSFCADANGGMLFEELTGTLQL